MVLNKIISIFGYLSSETLQKIAQTNADINYVYMSGGDSRQDVTLRIKKNAENNYVVMTETNDEIKIEANSGSYLDVLLELEDALKKTDWDDMNHNDTIEITFEIMGNNKPRQVEVHISRESYDISVDRETPKGLGWLTGMFADGRSG